MTDWTVVTDLADQAVEATTTDHVLVIGQDTEIAAVIAYVEEWFGVDDARSQLRLLVDGSDCGVLHRADAHALAAPADRGAFGAGDHGSLPGYSTTYEVVTFHCPEHGCEVRASTLHYDPHALPTCAVHHVSMKVDD